MLRRFFKRRRFREELAPEDIFLDASNLPSFNIGQLEGRLEKPLKKSAFTSLGIAIFLVLVVLVVQAGRLGVIEGERYALQSERNRLRNEVIFAKRGAIVDRNGIPLAYNEDGETGFDVRTYKYPGFSSLLGYVSYPKKDSSGHYYETEIEGLAGIEAFFDQQLKGTNGRLLVEEDAKGVIQSQGSVIPATDGETLTLSIDSRVQEAFYSSLSELADRIPFQGGAAMLMDVETGEVIALASFPEYDSNILSKGENREVIASYNTNPRRVYLNRATGGLYAPGSIVKPVVAAGAYNDGIISAEKIIVSTGALTIPNPYNPDNPTVFKDWKAHGAVDMRKAIAVSSDVYFYTIGGGFGDQKGLGIERLKYWYETFGYTTETGIELPSEKSGFVPDPAWKQETYDEPWRIGNTYHTSIGQYAMQVTPLEALRAVAAVANGGKLLKPTLIKDAPLQGKSITISSEALRIAREGMRQGVLEGTAKGLNVGFTDIAAKTGTAEIGAAKDYVNAWVVGFFPYDKPKYAFAVVMERGPVHNTVGGVYVAVTALQKLNQSAPEYFK